MHDLHYTHADLASVYDIFNGWSTDRAFYAALPDKAVTRILEVGCGTGIVARAMAASGHDVTGLDPAEPMLAVARAAPSGDQVRWICGTLPGFAADPFDLIFMTGHAFQCLLSDHDIATFFHAAANLLRPNGRLVFETRNPAAKAWEGWIPLLTEVSRQGPDGVSVTEWHDLVSVDGERVSFTSVYQFPHQQLTSHSTLRFASQSLIARLAEAAGLRTRSVYGDWDQSPITNESPELIFDMVKT